MHTFIYYIFSDCNGKRCTGKGYLDQNCNCLCPDGSRDCYEGKTQDTCKQFLYMYNYCHYYLLKLGLLIVKKILIDFNFSVNIEHITFT